MRSKRPAPIPCPVSIEIGGSHYTGKYVVDGKLITASAYGHSEPTQIGGLPIEELAKMILAGIIRKRTPPPA